MKHQEELDTAFEPALDPKAVGRAIAYFRQQKGMS